MPAQHGYAQFLLDGVGLEKNEAIGLEYLKRAADQGFLAAQLQFAFCFARDM
jgi:TPR repeat protein